ncbi:uncharacterized protein DFL_008733 [Arthrobotrys flagrans]|uniref:Sec20 C-terminal domain-containing protein n=1 Tax=Arthrobotrys flagrans TaxID=97331 RepID=A0A436ZPQ8_ARTFL|nr:hypothetical protein DFL_008733 [Arthrobotrys flagrans]
MSAASSEISERIAVLTNAYQEVATYIDRLANLTAPGTEEARNELAGLIHQSLNEGDAELETLTLQTATLNPSADPQAALHSRLHKLQEDFKHARTIYRKSLLHSKRSSTLNARREREAVLLHQQLQSSLPPSPTPPSPNNDNDNASPSTPLPLPVPGSILYRRPYHRTASKSSKSTHSDLLTSASSDVTTALRRTHALMTSELTRSHFASQTLAQSTETLKQLGSNYSTFDNVISKSKGLITDLVKRNKSDMWYYQMSLYVLVGTIGWLIFRRLLWGPVFLVVWLPLRMLVWMALMPFRGGEVGVGSGSGGGGNAIGKVESVVGGGDARSEVRKVVESITPEGGGGNAIEEPSVKKVVLSNGEEVGIPLETPLNPVEVQGEWVEESNEGNEGNHDEL